MDSVTQEPIAPSGVCPQTYRALIEMVYRLSDTLRRYPAEMALVTEAQALIGPLHPHRDPPNQAEHLRHFTTVVPIHRRRAVEHCVVCTPFATITPQALFYNASHRHKTAITDLTRYQTPRAIWEVDGRIRMNGRVLLAGDVIVANAGQYHHYSRAQFHQHFRML